MQVPPDVKKCVVFIGLMKADESLVILGTGFLFVDQTRKVNVPVLVTAKHVLDGIKGTGLDEIYVRVNLKDDTSEWYVTKYTQWILNPDPNIDIAIFVVVSKTNWDHVFYSSGSTATTERIVENQIDTGDEVFIVGLFVHHHGSKKNIPIVRVGNISAMPSEKIQTAKHLMDGYLIEARSIGGLSGSPVFVNFGLTRLLNGKVRHSINAIGHLLIGVIYGHYNDKGVNEFEKLNTGIAIVTPIEKVMETIAHGIEIRANHFCRRFPLSDRLFHC
jgi:hypothetical protein